MNRFISTLYVVIPAQASRKRESRVKILSSALDPRLRGGDDKLLIHRPPFSVGLLVGPRHRLVACARLPSVADPRRYARDRAIAALCQSPSVPRRPCGRAGGCVGIATGTNFDICDRETERVGSHCREVRSTAAGGSRRGAARAREPRTITSQ
jgi:hypothetical protein